MRYQEGYIQYIWELNQYKAEYEKFNGLIFTLEANSHHSNFMQQVEDKWKCI